MARVRSKKNKTKETLNYEEVKSVYSDLECNELIKNGWKIVHAGVSTIDSNGYNVKPTFIMAKEKEV